MNLRRLTGSARQEFEAAYSQRQVVLKKSRIPVCEKADALMQLARTLKRHELAFARKTLDEHAAECPICRERKEYADRHGPPLPPPPGPGWSRVIDIANNLARLLRVPEGETGKGRTMGLYVAVHYYLFAVVATTISLARDALRSTLTIGYLGESLAVMLVAPIFYIPVFFLAGSVFDATRRVENRFIGYLIRGAVATTVVYGAFALLLALVTKSIGGPALWAVPLALGAVGALAGTLLWVMDRARGRV